jgi:DNA-binding response OmpR family regulator
MLNLNAQVKPRLLLVEDDRDINQLICLNLEALDFSVTSCSNGTEGLELGRCGHFDLILLDIMLPGIDGLSVCKKLREEKIFTPILMLTAKNAEADRVIGLEVGADDYISKPFSILELQARVKAILRRVQFNITLENSVAVIQAFGDLKIDREKRSVMMADQEIHLTAKEFDLLLYLASSPGRVFSRNELLDSVWGYKHSGYQHTVNSHVNRLRSKLEKDPANPNYVLTVWGVGYKFNG